MGPKKVAAKSGGGSSKAKDAGKQVKSRASTSAEPVAGGEKVPKSVADARKARGGDITAEQVVEILDPCPPNPHPSAADKPGRCQHKPAQTDPN